MTKQDCIIETIDEGKWIDKQDRNNIKLALNMSDTISSQNDNFYDS